MSKPQRLPDTGEDHDKVLEAKMAELIGTTTEVAKLRLSGVSCAAISAQFGISESLPREIAKGRCWKDALAQAKSELELTQ